jgi:hypothetical protein
MHDFISPNGVYTIAADETSGSNLLTFPLYVHKVVLLGQAANQVTLALYNAASVTGTPLIKMKTSITGDTEFNEQVALDFSPPVLFNQLTADIGGTNAEAKVYYTRA